MPSRPARKRPTKKANPTAKKPAWFDAKLPRFLQLKRDLQVDVVVVGGGITGVTAAYLVKKAGFRVALLERDRCARVDTGHTSAHLTYVTDTRLRQLVKTFGRDHARAVWDAGQAALEQIATTVETEMIDCDFGWVPGYLHAPWSGSRKNDAEELREDAELAQEFGFDAAYMDEVPFAELPGVRFANQARFHPLKYLAHLLERIPGRGSHVFENSEADKFHDDPRSVEVNGKTVRFDYAILATHVPLMGRSSLPAAAMFQTKMASYSSYVIAARVPKGRVPDALFWDTASPYHYLRVQPRPRFDLVIFGGNDHKTGQQDNPEECYGKLERTLASILPDAKVQSRWSGQVVETHDGLPLIGETAERQFVATGFAGNGMTFGTMGAMMAVDALQKKKNPWQDLFDVSRKKLSSLWDYLKENIDYPYYYVKDKLLSGDGKSVRSLKPGEGKILHLNGQRVAAYRDDTGNVTKLSPNCTHMGCVVHWNSAEATWDCPCHGSRFRPTGEVLAGPAERPLEPVDQQK